MALRGAAPSTTWLVQALATICSLLIILPRASQGVTVRYSVLEEVPSGTRVGDVRHDAGLYDDYLPAQIESFSYRQLDPASKGSQLFLVSNTSGIVRTRDQLDREQICPNQLTCEVKLGVVYTAADIFNVIDVVIEIVDINDNAPTFPQKSVSIVIPESASPGGTYNLPLAKDPDSGSNGVSTYVLQSKSANFDLKVITIGNNDFPTTLQLELTQRLDREETPLYQVVVVATDGGDMPKSGALTINITVGDANDNGPVFMNETYRVQVQEDQAVGSKVIQVSAHDPDIGDNGRILYGLLPGSADSSLGTFEVLADTGEVMLKTRLDYESKHSYHLIVEARDGGVNSQPAYTNVIIDVADINNNAPQISVNTKNATSDVAHISELVEAGKFVAHISVRDPDTGPGGSFDCRINDDHFVLQKIATGQFKVVTAARLDHEEKHEYRVLVTCADKGMPKLVSEKTIRVKVIDENDNAPVFSRSTFSVTFPENNYLNKYVTQVNATDADLGANAALTYELGLEGREMFNIDSKTGIIRANGVFDYEKEKMYIFPVVARDGGSPPKSGSALVSVTISDRNDEAPTFSKSSYVFDVLENQPVGMEIGILSAVDADSDEFNYFEFSLASSGASANFAVDRSTGHVRTKKVLDREKQAVYHLVVTASNVGSNPLLSGSALLTVNVLDQNDHAPTIHYPNENNYTVQVSTGVPEGYLVGLIQADDQDTGSNAQLRYAITSGDQDKFFTIDPVLGAISTRRSLHHMPSKLYNLKITVSDTGFPARHSTAILHVVLNNTLAYPGGPGDPAKLLSGTNVTIVVSLAIASGVVVVVLVVAIVIIRKKEVGKRKRNPVYRCQIEAKAPPGVTNVNEKAPEQLKPGRRSNSQGSVGKGGNKKEVSFNMPNNENNLNALSNGKVLNTEKPGVTTLSTPAGKGKSEALSPVREYTTVQLTCPSPASGGGRGVTGTPTESMGFSEGRVALPPQQNLWEIDPSQLQTHYMLEKADRGDDSDSAYSGDVSNTDSGRGPSEEGEMQAQGMPFYTSASGKVPHNTTPVGPSHVDTLQRLHKWQHQQQKQPNNKLYPTPPQQQGRPPRYPMDPHSPHGKHLNNSICPPHGVRTPDVKPLPPRTNITPQGKPLPPPRKSSAKDDLPHVGRNGYPPHPNHGYRDDWRMNNNSLKHWDTLHEDDDCASSTSGSYIVDPSDLDLDGCQPAVMV